MSNIFRDSDKKKAVEGKSKRETPVAAPVAEPKPEPKVKTETKPREPKAAETKRESKPSAPKYDINEILQPNKKQPGKTVSFYLDVNIIEEIEKLAEKNKMKKSEVVNEILKKVLIS